MKLLIYRQLMDYIHTYNYACPWSFKWQTAVNVNLLADLPLQGIHQSSKKLIKMQVKQLLFCIISFPKCLT